MKPATHRISFPFIASVVIILTIVVYACKKEVSVQESRFDQMTTENSLIMEQIDLSEVCGTIQTKDVLTSNGEIIGQAFVYNTSFYFVVTMVASSNYSFNAARLHLAQYPSDIPRDYDQAPYCSKFEYSQEQNTETMTKTIKVPLEDVPEFTQVSAFVIFSTSPEKQGHNIAWVSGDPIGQSDIGQMFTFRKEVCCEIEN